MSFTPVRKRRLADQVADAVREAIFRGRFQPGDSLPAERQLAEQFGVNRSSIREAIVRLEAVGLVEVRQGGGTMVTDFLATAGLSVLPWLLAPGGQLDPKLLRDLLELRVALLGFAGEKAAANATAEQIVELEEALVVLESASDLDAVQKADFAFFQLVVVATGNRVLTLVINAIGRVYRDNQVLFGALYELPLDTEPHRRALVAFGDRDGVAARSALEHYGQRAVALVNN